MTFTRRDLLRRVGAGAAATIASSATEALAFKPYRALVPGDPVRLHRNENPEGPSASVLKAIADAARDATERYPDAAVDDLRDRIAQLHAVAAEQVVLGCGSTDILRMAADAFLAPHKKLVLAAPTYERVEGLARRTGAECVGVPLRKDFAHDLDAIRAKCDASTGVVYICNPNNPTGSLTPRADIDRFLAGLPPTIVVIVDEAYHEYAGTSREYLSLVDRAGDGRLIVTRTFSKAHGLAGLRVGYAITAAPLAERLAAGGVADAVSVVAARAAIAAIDGADHARVSAARNEDARQEFFNQANARMLRVVDSHANFVLMNAERTAAGIAQWFKTQAVLVAPAPAPFDTWLRVSLGSQADMRTFWRTWDRMPGRKMTM